MKAFNNDLVNSVLSLILHKKDHKDDFSFWDDECCREKRLVNYWKENNNNNLIITNYYMTFDSLIRP